ncbi:MAG: recombinase family protein [Blautia faecis]
MKNQILKKIYRAVVYLRLSDEDGDNRESDSISNQRILIHSFLKSHPEIQVVKECVDDGYTGTNFNRPGFQEMLRMLEEGEADCVVKDLSRYGRDFSGVYSMWNVSCRKWVRLILVNDNYDSLTPNRDFLTLRFKSLINDLYPADTSKSVRSHLYVKMTAGQCVAPFAFYGYLKSEEDKHKLVMDEVAASVVRDIYHMKMQGYSLTDISEELNRRGILTPLRYKQVYLKQKLKTGFRLTEKPVWMPTMVRRILLDERYTGVLIQGKTTTPNHKVKVVIHKEEAEWIRYENAFEPVINRHQYEVVGNLMKMDTMRGAKGLALLSGLVKCGDCKESMVLKSPDKVHHYYVCSTSLYEKQCSSHSISEKKLVGAVTEAILHYISVLMELKEILAYVKTASIPRQRLLEEDKKLEMLEKESQRILNIKVKLYDSFAEEILDRTEFETFKAKYDQSLEEIRQAMECQQGNPKLAETLEKQQVAGIFSGIRNRTEVDRLMLVNLVKRIEVYERKRIIIHFWFEDEFEKVLGLLETVNRAKPDQRVEAFLKERGRKQVPKVSKEDRKDKTASRKLSI